MERIPINVDKDGCSYCLVSKYYKEKAKIAKYLMGGHLINGNGKPRMRFGNH